MPESPRPPQDDHGSWTRRQFPAAGGVAATGVFAGYSGLLGTGPRVLDIVVHESLEDELLQDFPGQSDAESIGYVEVRRKPQFDSEGPIPSPWFTFDASIDLSSSYKLDQFTATLATLNTYFDQHDQFTYLVSPSARGDSLNTYCQWVWDGTTHRQSVMDMDDIGLDGTIQLPFTIRDLQALPSTLQRSLSVQATESGMFGETVTTSGSGTFEFG